MVSKETIKTTYPLPVYNYKVEIDGVAVAFSEVSGLSIELAFSTYKESAVANGAVGPVVMHMPSQGNPPTITLKKGVVKSNSVKSLYDWINTRAINQIVKKDIYVRLCDENGAAVISWKVLNAFPVKLDAPTFDAKGNDAAIEAMQIRADKIVIEEAA